MINVIENLEHPKSISDIINDLNELILTLNVRNNDIIDEVETVTPEQKKTETKTKAETVTPEHIMTKAETVTPVQRNLRISTQISGVFLGLPQKSGVNLGLPQNLFKLFGVTHVLPQEIGVYPTKLG